jgi:hypothetical protein
LVKISRSAAVSTAGKRAPRGQQQIAVVGDALALLLVQAGLDAGGQAGTGSQVPAQHRLGGELVDVPAARATRTDESP